MKNKKIKRNTQLFLVTGFLILFAAQSNKWVAKVNGDSVTVEEFKLAIERNR